MRWFTADLHVHTDLSPCAKSMSPDQVVRAAESAGVDVIAICDHNSAANVAAVQAAAAQVVVLPGLEVNTREEVHLVCLFDHLEGALALQEMVYRELPGENDEGIFGPQWLYNEEGDRIGLERKFLAGSCRLSMQAVIALVNRLGGLVIAPHPMRTYGGIIGVLGFIPKDLQLGALRRPRRIAAPLSPGEIPGNSVRCPPNRGNRAPHGFLHGAGGTGGDENTPGGA